MTENKPFMNVKICKII